MAKMNKENPNQPDAIFFLKNQKIQNIIVPEYSQQESTSKVYPSTILKGNSAGELSILRQGDPEFLKKLLAFDTNIKAPS